MTYQYWQYIISTNQVMVGLVIDAVTTLRSRWDEVFTSNQCWCIFESASLINPATVELRLVTQNLWKCQNIVTQLDFIYPSHVCSVHVTVLCTLNVNMLLLQFDLSLDTSHYLFFVPLDFAGGYILYFVLYGATSLFCFDKRVIKGDIPHWIHSWYPWLWNQNLHWDTKDKYCQGQAALCFFG